MTDLSRWRRFLERFGLRLIQTEWDHLKWQIEGDIPTFDRSYADATVVFDSNGKFVKLEVSE